MNPVPLRPNPIARIIFASRWIQLPIYLGLIVVQMIYAWKFLKALWHLIVNLGIMDENTIMLAVLNLIDVVMIAEKQRQKVSDCRATVTAKRADEAPRVFTEIHIHFKVFGTDLKESAIAQAVRLSAEKYCSASIMLGKAAAVTHSFEIVECV